MKRIGRPGLIGKKVGMTQIFSENGEAIPVTLIDIKGNVVLAKKTSKDHGYDSVLLGYGDTKKVNKPQRKLFEPANSENKSVTLEFRVYKDVELKLGSEISVEHFVVGQYVDVVGVTIGKGFAGVMKRHNFRGLRASHGVSVSHRSAGSTGQCQDPGRVFKGKKMAGRMGGKIITMQNIEVCGVDKELGLLILKGAVPGPKGSILKIHDACKRALNPSAAYPAALV